MSHQCAASYAAHFAAPMIGRCAAAFSTRPAPIISIGHTNDEVTADFGEPQRKVAAGAKEIFFYTDLKMKVIFTGGKVSSID